MWDELSQPDVNLVFLVAQFDIAIMKMHPSFSVLFVVFLTFF